MPFEVNIHTLNYFINHYGLNWEIEGNKIINKDFIQPKVFIQEKLNKLIAFSHNFRSIHLYTLAQHLEIDLKTLKFILISYKYYLESKGIRLTVRDELVVNLNKL